MPDTEYRLGRLNDHWVVTWWEGGHRRRYRLSKGTRKDAERELATFIQTRQRQSNMTVEGLWMAYLKEKAGRRVVRSMTIEWQFLGPVFGHLEPQHITIDLCRSYVAKRRVSGKKGTTQDGTIWTEMGHLRTVLVWAAKSRLIDHAPRIERPAKPKPKDRYLTREEAAKLMAAPMAPHIKLAITLMLTTAARVGAALDLTWSRVDLERRVIRLGLDDATTRKGRATLPINDTLYAALVEARKGAMSDYVIEWAGSGVVSIKTGFNAAVKAAGLEGVTPHVLRHTAAVWLAEDGTDMEEIAQYLGHEDSRITRKVYARFSPQHLRKAASSLDFAKNTIAPQ